MTGAAIALVIGSAFLHAAWNLLAKRSSGQRAFMALALVAALLLYAPVFAVLLSKSSIPPRGWLFIGASAVIHAGYYLFLGGAYARSDLSVVYPLARGTGPLFVLIISAVLLREFPTRLGLAGIALVIVGVFLLHSRDLSLVSPRAAWRALFSPGSRFALLTGVTIGMYSTVDKAGVALVHPLVYMYLCTAGAVVCMVPFLLRRPLPRPALVRREGRSALVAGALLFGAYWLVLTAMTTTKVSYVAAARETSILIAAIYGRLVLKEHTGSARQAGALALAAGVALIALAG